MVLFAYLIIRIFWLSLFSRNIIFLLQQISRNSVSVYFFSEANGVIYIKTTCSSANVRLMITLWPLAHRRNKASVFVFLPEPRDERGNMIDTCMGDRNLTALTSWHVAAPVTNTRVFFQAARLVCHVFWSALARRRRSRWFVRLWQPANTMCSHIWLHYISGLFFVVNYSQTAVRHVMTDLSMLQ